jgi:cation diffusion facilitator family transporter
MTVKLRDEKQELPLVERAATELGYALDPLGEDDDGSAGGDPSSAHQAPAYRRALILVVILNLGYGVIELTGGFAARSQSLKADALDFLGDGLITLFGVLAIAWSDLWRARAALLQGIFLGVLGVSVLGATAYRVFFLRQPEADLMGIFGFAALIVNVVSALVLIPHRAGDANVRAVWLFSRNDALSNIAVIAAAGMVAWTGTPWPDLVVAVVIAALFIHSSISIVRDARTELLTATK